MKKGWKKIINIFLILVFLTAVCIIWEQIVNSNNIPKRILPKPSQIIEYIAADIGSGKSTLIIKTLQSLTDAIIGFTIATVLGVLIGLFFTSQEKFRVVFSPYMLVLQFLPVPAFAPIIASMLGYGSATKIFIIVLFTIFPVIVTVEKAVVSLPENYFSLFKSYNVNRFSLYKKMILPAIVPDLLTTLKILTTASFVTSIIAELPLTVSSGIGKDIYNSFNNQVTTRVWSSLILISIFSLIFFYLIVFLEKYILLKYRYGKS
jgi:NitT/TauT family transport system permease protein